MAALRRDVTSSKQMPKAPKYEPFSTGRADDFRLTWPIFFM
jgi:hypothetical protein